MEMKLPATFPVDNAAILIFKIIFVCPPSFTGAVATTYPERVCKLDTFAATKFPLSNI